MANYVHTHNTSVYFLRDYVTIAMVIFSENLLFSRVKISCLRGKAHSVRFDLLIFLHFFRRGLRSLHVVRELNNDDDEAGDSAKSTMNL